MRALGLTEGHYEEYDCMCKGASEGFSEGSKFTSNLVLFSVLCSVLLKTCVDKRPTELKDSRRRQNCVVRSVKDQTR